MRTAVDSSVLLDVLSNDAAFASKSETALRRASAEGSLVIGECVLAEIRPALPAAEIDEFLSDWNLDFVPSTRESALVAGEMFQAFLQRRPARTGRVVADFLIGAHAQYLAERLLTRDRGFYRDYFGKLTLLEP